MRPCSRCAVVACLAVAFGWSAPPLRAQQRLGSLRGQILYQCSGRPATVPFDVALFDAPVRPFEFRLSALTVRTGPRGVFSFRNLTPGDYALQFSPYRGQTFTGRGTPVQVEPGTVTQVTLTSTLCPDIVPASPSNGQATGSTPVFEWAPFREGARYQVYVDRVPQSEETYDTTAPLRGELRPRPEPYEWMVCVVGSRDAPSRGPPTCSLPRWFRVVQYPDSLAGWFERARRACAVGEMSGCGALGTMYRDGLGVAPDTARALALYRRACDGADSSACGNLGGMYRYGRGVAEDHRRAAALYQRACEGGESSACSSLAAMYRVGRGVARDYARALALYRRACDGGEMEGCDGLGQMYKYGVGVPKNDTLAAALYRRACDGGYSPACAQVTPPRPRR